MTRKDLAVSPSNEMTLHMGVMLNSMDYLIERVQELEDIIYQDERQAVLEGMYEQNERYREAIKRAIGKFNYDEHQEGMSILQKALEGDLE